MDDNYKVKSYSRTISINRDMIKKHEPVEYISEELAAQDEEAAPGQIEINDAFGEVVGLIINLAEV